MHKLRWAFSFALAVGVLFVAAAPASAIRYAAPTAQGSGNCSSAANACTISNAVEGGGGVPFPPSGEEIVVLPGTHVLPDVLLPSGTLNIHGQDGSPRPTLRLSGVFSNAVVSSLTSPGTMRHLRIEGDNLGTTVATVNADGAAIYSDLEVVSTGTTQVGIVLHNGALLRDSAVRVVDHTAGVAVRVSQGTTNKLLNVTGVANAGTDAVAASVYDFGSGGNETWKLTVVNSILDGGSKDLVAEGSNVGDNITIDVRNSNYAVGAAQAFGSHLNDLGGNQATAPLFANFAGGDFHEVFGSTTIDAGTTDPQLGSTDMDGESRTMGTAPDMGADEFVPVPPGGGGSDTGTPPPPPGPGLILACTTVRRGTRLADRLFGTGASDLLIGGRGNDLLRGRAGNDCLRGERGRDRLEGGDGDDQLLGGDDADVLAGGAGADRMDGGTGADKLGGGSGADVLAGGSGPDRLSGDAGVDVHRAGPGNDVVSAADGHREIVDCGSGRDVARVDRSDRVSHCERVVRVR
jgi:Ca2+-binding RTX toxin-like protein